MTPDLEVFDNDREWPEPRPDFELEPDHMNFRPPLDRDEDRRWLARGDEDDGDYD
jgi:hypothetical protein